MKSPNIIKIGVFMMRRIFIISVIIGLMANLFGDYSVLRQNEKTIQSGEWVSHSYKVTRAIERSRAAVLEAMVPGQKNPEINFKELAELVKGMPQQEAKVAELNKLSPEELREKENNKALVLLFDMAESEEAVLEERLNQDRENNLAAEKEMLTTNGIDLLMIFLILGFFLFEFRSNRKLLSSLSKTLLHVEESNARLLTTLSERDAKFKTVVHDLKNPLGAIKGFAEILKDEISGSTSNSVAEMASIIQRVSNDTLSLVGNVLSSSAETDAQKEHFDLYEMISETCLFLEPIADEKRQKIRIQKKGVSFAVFEPRRKVQDMLFNLVGNALKFSPAESMVTVDCFNEDGFVQVKIKDEGPGFAESDFSNLFMPGAKLSAKPTGGEVSTGFGLYSARQTVMQLGGSIDIRNNPDKGACVSVSIPSVSI